MGKVRAIRGRGGEKQRKAAPVSEPPPSIRRGGLYGRFAFVAFLTESRLASPWIVSVSVVLTTVSVTGTASPAVVSTPGTVVVSAVSLLSVLLHAATAHRANATNAIFFISESP